jgi:ubiquinol-cytochrome c reductase cytochrome c subunit
MVTTGIRLLSALFVLVLSACTTASYGETDAPAGSGATMGGDKKIGATLFAANCANCHGPQGAGGGIGPSLRDEARRMNFETLASWIQDPEPPMRKLYPTPLADEQVRDVAAYVETL